MSSVDVRDAQRQLHRLVGLLARGTETEIVISRSGHPVAKLVPVAESIPAGRRLGLLAGQFPRMSLKAFNADDDAIAASFHGGDPE